ncbi:MAG: TPM domain-containing protein [Eubacterium sp.]
MKKVLSVILTIILMSVATVTAFAEQDTDRLMPRLVDNADILNDSEEDSLLKKLNEISERQDFDVVVVTVDSLEGKTARDYADDFYDYNGYGMGNDNDGVLLLVSMEARDWWMSTTGFGITAITDAGIDYISDKFLDDMGDDEYAKAFDEYAELCDKFVTQAKTGEPYDVGNMPKEPFAVFRNLLIALAAGIVLSLIIVLIMRSQMKTVRRKPAASDYMKKGSMVINESRDLFLYTHLDRQKKPKNNSSGGSSTHKSSSGTTHGGGGGKF